MKALSSYLKDELGISVKEAKKLAKSFPDNMSNNAVLEIPLTYKGRHSVYAIQTAVNLFVNQQVEPVKIKKEKSHGDRNTEQVSNLFQQGE